MKISTAKKMKEDNKLNHITKAFGNNGRKTMENYVVNAIWNRIDEPGLYPRTQQPFKRSGEGKRAYVDLYFRQLNLGVECDEFYHTTKKQRDSDKQRESDIKRELDSKDMLGAYSETEGYHTEHVEAYGTFDEVESEIERVVGEVKKRIQQLKDANKWVDWNYNLDNVDLAKKNGKITVSDNFTFRYKVDFLKLLNKTRMDGKPITAWQPADCPINDNYTCWVALKAKMLSDKSSKSGYTNLFSDDQHELLMVQKDDQKIAEEHFSNIEKVHGKKKTIVFAKYTDQYGDSGYRFFGVYVLDKLTEHDKHKAIRYERESTDLDLTQFRCDNVNKQHMT